ncbi:MAG: hypothetical protein WCT53_03495 [Candidatus Gracilibacteria bacterium]
MANPEIKQQKQSFEKLLANHTIGTVNDAGYAKGIIIRRVQSTLVNWEEGKTRPEILDNGCIVIVPYSSKKDEAPQQVCIREGEPRDFGTPIATVSAEELMGAMKFAHGAGFSTVAVPTWKSSANRALKDCIQYKIYAEKRPASPDVGTKKVTDAGQDTAEQVKITLQS